MTFDMQLRANQTLKSVSATNPKIFSRNQGFLFLATSRGRVQSRKFRENIFNCGWPLKNSKNLESFDNCTSSGTL